ncbi:1-(5-phosphoribosyl)-5-[(5-phosphoribosylamino)methylideneamino]imidazole-4-carboxamide isomerase [Pelagibacterales bacterium]|jgi:phosphoribosylformimino-5-aminoimidazole carboxamide ribotide isomerase|nr:1-(5-phosphoribosyl)-5-[(5-phosphoribosylamino)methylideneamino]imidazole-4-carboxamide isomerase [Pelagibacterales bacterium]|tara:strand:- start:317 stop:1039 length:723 start_codon:yes stop_codon:yes gene_type:complete
MILFPAIDLKSGQCVRLSQGNINRVKIYNSNPLDQAKIFESQGVEWLHCVDLDGAFEGISKNLDFIESISSSTNLKIQFGGGVRDEAKVSYLLDLGVSNVIMGTSAIENTDLFKKIIIKYPNQISLALDIKENLVSTKGWVEQVNLNLEDFFSELNKLPLNSVICTDIMKDGMKKGINIEMLENVMALSKAPCVASGGIASLNDLIQLKNSNYINLKGVIAGKAIYDNEFTIQDALKVLK